ncbi:iron-sulfur cluster assembly protein IscA [Candidatus Woesearchaeota archaeon CG10_big_fil_rev_8_21_14_0_10_30_7]|nr:MAG: iron-sulfur cluster assembly protein IscA [Candidatus Woesearchaeota archaeon CG10_big_fil_rev_8_21_14_0_10_30_7]
MTIKITEQAAKKVKEAIESQLETWLNSGMIKTKNEVELGFKLGLLGGGCSGFKYDRKISEKDENDHVFENHGVKIFMDPKSYLYLQGTTIDYVSDGLEGTFTYDTPMASGSCGCGESVNF